RDRYGTHVWRLGIDAGFTCPHRSLDRQHGGCRYCAPDGNIAAYQKGMQLAINAGGDSRAYPEAISSVVPLETQITRALRFTTRRYGAHAFFIYFQAYTCTNAPVSVLEELYTETISICRRLMEPGQLKGLVVSTRPDCFDSEKAALLASYMGEGLEVWVEFGLQSAYPSTLAFIHRGHDITSFLHAMETARVAGLRRTVHLMLGLPGESHDQMVASSRFVAQTKPEGLKFHDLRIVKGSAFARSFPTGEISCMHPSRLPALLADCLEVLPMSTEIIRLSADFRSEETIQVHPPLDKHRLARQVEEELALRDSFQGQRFQNSQEGGP
ncbi:MAG: TIGR01212 family radical SAM protein, partial [Rectinema sp.]|nr:TIGR01212 family radical SAM protein [Rectinema sp.]